MPIYEAQKKQVPFHLNEADEVFYGGAVGGGKSYAILWDAVSFCLKYPKGIVAIFRRTYPELEKSIILIGLGSIPQKYFSYNKKEHRMYFKNGSILEFNYCLFDSDVYNFQSAQYDRIYFDELTHFSKFIYLYLQSRCRTTNPDIKPQIKSASNPGNVGHEWVKKRFIEGAEPDTICVREDPETHSTYTTSYIPAKLTDNKYLMEGDPQYITRLMKLPTEERRALLEGDWTILKGQFFSEFRYDIHVIDPFAIPKWWTRIRCLDWGFAKPACCLWLAFSPQGVCYLYRELVRTETTDVKLAAEILDLSKGEDIKYTMADPSLWSINQYERGESVAMRFITNGVSMIKADNNRVAGWNVIHSYLYWDEKQKPKLHFFKNCFYMIESLPALIRDDNNPEDVNTKGDDHGGDALRYGLTSKPILGKRPMTGIPQYSFQYWINKYEDDKNKGYVGGF